MANLLDDEDDQPLIDPNKDYFDELVGEGKKFRDPKELAKGKMQSDLYIKDLERKLDEMREDYLKLDSDYKSRAKLEELMDQLKTQQLTSSDENLNAKEVSKAPQNPDEIKNLVKAGIQEYETTRKQEQNLETVRNKLKERYGENYKQSLKQQMDSLDLDEEMVERIARDKPNVLVRMLGLDQAPSRETFQTPPRAEGRFVPRTEKRTWAWYQNLKRENPKLYHDQKTNVQMHKDIIELGEAFKDGNWFELNQR